MRRGSLHSGNPRINRQPTVTHRTFSLFVASLRRMDFLERQWLLVQRRLATNAGELPGGDVHIVVVVAPRFAVGRLALLAEMAAARLAPMERVERQQLG